MLHIVLVWFVCGLFSFVLLKAIDAFSAKGVPIPPRLKAVLVLCGPITLLIGALIILFFVVVLPLSWLYTCLVYNIDKDDL